MRKRLLSDTISKLHENFGSKSKDMVSYVIFARFRLFWLRTPTAKDHETRLCLKHDNSQLKVDILNQLQILDNGQLDSVVNFVCCNTSSKSCMYRECDACANNEIPYKGDVDDDNYVFWCEWCNEVQEYQKNGKNESSRKWWKN